MNKYKANYPVKIGQKMIEADEVFEADQATVDKLNAKGAMCKQVGAPKAASKTKPKPAIKKTTPPPPRPAAVKGSKE